MEPANCRVAHRVAQNDEYEKKKKFDSKKLNICHTAYTKNRTLNSFRSVKVRGTVVSHQSLTKQNSERQTKRFFFTVFLTCLGYEPKLKRKIRSYKWHW